MKKVKIYTVDAFTDQTFHGNACGVVVDASDLNTEEMQKIAREVNLSETAFLVNSEKDMSHYRIRYFTPTDEVDFCGHATLGTAWILGKRYKKINQLYFETNVGVVNMDLNYNGNILETVVMTQVIPKVKDIKDDVKDIFDMVGVSIENYDDRYPVKLGYTGIWHLFVPVKTKKAVDEATPDMKKLSSHNKKHHLATTHLYTFDTKDDDILIYTRDFAPSVGVDEDPVTGSANGALAGMLALESVVSKQEYKIIQGNRLGRIGTLYIKVNKKEKEIQIQVGGKAVIVIEGYLNIKE